MKNTNQNPRASAARHGLLELIRREDDRQELRRNGFALKAHDLVTRELREQSAKDCLAASKEARDDGAHREALEWAEAYGRQEHLASRMA
tara:strand:- start:55632 stop:55901 length:270 start_codon:yes stop_codon:yes gene_type:complete